MAAILIHMNPIIGKPAVAVQSLQMPLKKRSTTNVTGAEILGEPIRFKPFSKFCKKKKKEIRKKKKPHLALDILHVLLLGPVK